MSDNSFDFHFIATGIGSVPFEDIGSTCRDILDRFPSMPYWPQFVRRSYVEEMSAQYCEGLPLLEIREQERSIVISSDVDQESELTRFYEHFISKDIDYFAISRAYAPGLYTLLELIEQGAGGEGPFIKGQTVGPVTFAAGILGRDGKPIIHDPELLEAMVGGLAIKALWQVRELGKSGRKPVIFLDEPYLSGFGSAFSSIERKQVIDILKSLIDYIKENSDALIGIHCCGNTDWPMLIEAGPDIINLDAFGYMDYFLLFPDEITRFLKAGGTVAWGIVPTSNFTGKETVGGLSSKLDEGFDRVYQWGIDPHMLAERSILTPACGIGTMTPESAEKGLDLLAHLSRKWTEKGSTA